jgi:hypothetical protein
MAARWFSWFTPRRPRVELFEPSGSGMKEMKSGSVPNCCSCCAPVCVAGLYSGAPALIGSPCRKSTCAL